MKKIDVFNHIYPGKYINYFREPDKMIQKLSTELPALVDVSKRIKNMDNLDIDMEILSLALPAIDDLHVPEKDSAAIMKSANDGILDIVEKYPDRFSAIGTVSLRDPPSALDEAKRCINSLHLKGIQIVSNVVGKPVDIPEYDEFYALLEENNVPLWLHPTFMRNTYDWLSENMLDIMIGWDYDTTIALVRLLSSGLIKRHMNLKIIVHHIGSLLPLFAGRISKFLDGSDDENGESMKMMKSLYVDTAEGMWKPWLDEGIKFFGHEHVLFGTDYPWGNSKSIIENIEIEDISVSRKEMIFSKNALRLLKI